MDLLVTDNQGGEVHELQFTYNELDLLGLHIKNLLINTQEEDLITIHITQIPSKTSVWSVTISSSVIKTFQKIQASYF